MSHYLLILIQAIAIQIPGAHASSFERGSKSFSASINEFQELNQMKPSCSDNFVQGEAQPKSEPQQEPFSTAIKSTINVDACERENLLRESAVYDDELSFQAYAVQTGANWSAPVGLKQRRGLKDRILTAKAESNQTVDMVIKLIDHDSGIFGSDDLLFYEKIHLPTEGTWITKEFKWGSCLKIEVTKIPESVTNYVWLTRTICDGRNMVPIDGGKVNKLTSKLAEHLSRAKSTLSLLKRDPVLFQQAREQANNLLRALKNEQTAHEAEIDFLENPSAFYDQLNPALKDHIQYTFPKSCSPMLKEAANDFRLLRATTGERADQFEARMNQIFK